MLNLPNMLALTLASVASLLQGSVTSANEIPVADFEQASFGEWTTQGDAFGDGPAAGTLPAQLPVTGFLGQRLANSYHGGDDATGTLTSPPFEVERRYIRFLVGGGNRPGEINVNLLVDGQPVRSLTGPMPPGGKSEQLEWVEWEVGGLIGRTGRIELVDRAKGHWGHVTADGFVQTNEPLPQAAQAATRDFAGPGRYLNLPVAHNAPEQRLSLLHDAEVVREFDIQLAEGAADFWVALDLGDLAGESLTASIDELRSGSNGLAAIERADERVDASSAEEAYSEALRPQFHFTARRGWLNDPNGLVYHEGLWHLYYQHNPYGWNWGNMHWGHAVSRDLVHWEERPLAVYPREYGDWAYSGSAVVDHENTSGFGENGEAPLVAAFTSTGRGECILYSRDGGKTWEEYEQNPVIQHEGRDPRLLWHAPSGRWVMALYTEDDGKQWIAFYTSPDLKAWTYASRIEGFYECPDLLELPVEGRPGESRWVLYGGDGAYLLGEFDGERFTPTIDEKQRVWHGAFYAAQTFSNTPDGRCVQIGWARGVTFPGMPFNQQMSVPVALSLRATADGTIRLHAEPVTELEALRGAEQEVAAVALPDGEHVPLAEGELLDLEATLKLGSATRIGLRVRGIEITYDVAARRLVCGDVQTPLKAEEGDLTLRVLVDRGSVEVFAEEGRVALSVPIRPDMNDHTVSAFAQGGAGRVEQASVFEMRSAWSEAR